MAAQQHKILRQVLEARKCPSPDAQRVQAGLRDAYRQLLPLIDRICSSLSVPGRIHRIDRVEVDLGEVSLEALDTVLASRFESSFERELAAAIDGAPEVDSDLELFGLFVTTGVVPWWADLSNRALIETALDNSIRRAPEALARLMRQGGNLDRRLSRTARACPDRLLDDLAGVIAPSLLSFPRGRCAAWVTAIEALRPAQGYRAPGTRHLWWEEVLRGAIAGGEHASDPARFAQAVLTRVSQRLGMDYRSLLADLERALDDDERRVEVWVRDVVHGLWQEGGGQAARTGESAVPRESTSPGDRTRFLRLLDRLDARHDGLWAPLRAVIDRLPRDLMALATAETGRLDRVNGASHSDHALSRRLIDALVTLIRAALQQTLVAPETGARLIDALQNEVAGPDSGAATHASSHETDGAARVDEALAEFAFSHADQVYVQNAGLVILWPFLKTFFARAGLVETDAFTSRAAAHRGVGLLHYVATGEAPVGEHVLPLNKVLCGIPIEEVFDFDGEMTDAEREECDDLLVAVIHQAPILRQMSVAGFRGSFLLRTGHISLLDGHWLLRVERETHDIVLDRFPWSVHVVALPWMESPMQVEW